VPIAVLQHKSNATAISIVTDSCRNFRAGRWTILHNFSQSTTTAVRRRDNPFFITTRLDPILRRRRFATADSIEILRVAPFLPCRFNRSGWTTAPTEQNDLFREDVFDFRATVDREPAPMADACHRQAVLIHRDPEFTNLPETRESLSK